MKTENTKIISIFFVVMLVVIFTSSFVLSFGFTSPSPQNIELKPGQSSFFTFQVQTDEFEVTCFPDGINSNGLELAFNQEYKIGANQQFVIQPQVIVPENTPFGNYKADFCFKCNPSATVQGSKVIPRVCGLPVTVDVVSERTRENRFDVQETGAYVIWITLLSISIILLALVIFYLVRKRRRGA